VTHRARLALLALPCVAAWIVASTVDTPIVLAAFVLLALGGLVVTAVLAARSGRPQRERVAGLPAGQRWIAVSWFLMLAISEQRFTAGRSPLDATSGSVSPEIATELLVYGVTVLLIIRHWLPARATASRPVQVVWLFAWPALAFLSTTWSVVPLFSFVRGGEMLVPPLLAVHTGRVIGHMNDGGRALVRSTFRLFLGGMVVAVAIGWAIRPWPYDGLRFAWPGTHPLVVANLIGVACIVLIIAGRRVLGFSPWLRAGLLAYFGVALVYCQARTDYAALAVATLTGLWFAGRHRLGYRTLGLLYYGVAAGVFVALAQGQIFNIASRGGGYENAATFNGRTTLWTLALEQLHSVKDWLIGFGYGSPRVTLYALAEWTGSAHSSPIEMLLGLGLIGLIAFVIALCVIGFGLGGASRTRHLDHSVQVMAITLFAFIVVHGVVSSELVIPSSSCTMIGFLASFVVARTRQDTARWTPLPLRATDVPARAGSSVFG
jgi:hypothetical protein